MGSRADIPAPDAILCEECGYNLTGLVPEGRCPECGDAIYKSVSPDSRVPTAWEERPGVWSWLCTRYDVVWHPSVFARRMFARKGQETSRWFAFIERVIASLLFAAGVQMHVSWLGRGSLVPFVFPVAAPLLLVLLYALMWATAKLTAWEAAYRGLRLPRSAVERGLHYHAAHYTVVAAGMLLTQGLAQADDTVYIYSLCGFVIVAAGYLFFTYWAFMRRLLHANA